MFIDSWHFWDSYISNKLLSVLYAVIYSYILTDINHNGYNIISDKTKFPVYLIRLSCRGSENRVTDCPFSNITLYRSSYDLGLFVNCYVG